MISIRKRRNLLRILTIVTCLLIVIGIETGDKYSITVVSILVIDMLFYQTIQCTTYCPYCKNQLFGFFIASHTTGAELFKFVLGVREIKCHHCKKMIDTKPLQD